MWQDDWKYTTLSESLFETYDWSSGPQKTPIDWRAQSSALAAAVGGEAFIFDNGRLISQPKASIEAAVTLVPSAKIAGSTGTTAWQAPEWLLKRAAQQSTDNRCDISVTERAALWDPIFIVHNYQGTGTHQGCVSHWTLMAKPQSRLRVIELHVDWDGETRHGLHYAQTQICVGIGARVQHQLIHSIGSGTTYLQEMFVTLQSKADYELTAVSTGGEKSRANYVVRLAGDDAKVAINHMSWAKQFEKMDTHLEVRHEGQRGQSRIVTRGVAQHRGHSSVTGKIVVAQGAAKNQATLENKNLLLSPNAEINSRPQLEIDNDDVMCSHGATIGYLEQDALFYLRSRGIPEPEAKQLLIDSFIAPVMQTLEPQLTDYVNTLLGHVLD